MSGFHCWQAGVLLERRNAGLSEPQRLRLEEHLASCSSCAEDADLLNGLIKLANQVEPELSAMQRERALQQALRAQHEPVAARAPRPWLVAMPALLLITLGLWRVLAGQPAPSTPLARGDGAATTTANTTTTAQNTLQTQSAQQQLLSGELLVNGQPLPVGGSFPSDMLLAARSSARIDTGRARLTLAAGTRLIWQPAQSTVHLQAGEILAEVAKDPVHEFRISTREFDVVVTGTRFSVTPDAVHVSEGSVRVLGTDGRVLAAAVHAGEAWQHGGLQPSAAVAVQPTAAAHDDDHGHSADRDDAVTHGSVTALLRRARELLALGQAQQARAPIAQALSMHPGRSDRAEASSLRAETSLVAGEYELATDGYLEVADRYRDLPAAENALFAAARLQLSHGSRPRARALFTRYLTHYPQGRFQREVEAELAKLPAPH